jgi:sulfate/thiosulfate-binding protein
MVYRWEIPTIRSWLATLLVVLGLGCGNDGSVRLLNVSYDPTRELYREVNAVFAADWLAATGQKVKIQQSHGGSGKQARSVIDGLPADVVTLGLGGDIDAIASKSGRVARDWQSRLPQRSTPYTSTVVMVVRRGNPKAIRDWADLARPGVEVMTSNPKTSAGGRWAYVAAWGWALRQFGGDQAKAQDFLRRVFGNVRVLDTGARGTTVSFVERGIGDVMLAWENEAILAVQKLAPGKLEIVTPHYSVEAEPPVAVVDRNVERKGTRAVAEAYLRFLFTPAAQKLMAKHFYRPRDPAVRAAAGYPFPDIETFTVDAIGGWSAIQKLHMAEGGVFDRLQER